MTTLDKKAVIKSPIGLLATWFGSGLFPKAPGTMGSLAALPFSWAIVEYGGAMELLIAAIAIAIIGIPISNAYMKQFDAEHDPKEIVIDEVAGMWLTLALLMLPLGDEEGIFSPLLVAVGFVLFRLFDIKKPWPVSWADKKLGGGIGVMLDDVFAGIMAPLAAFMVLFIYFTIAI